MKPSALPRGPFADKSPKFCCSKRVMMLQALLSEPAQDRHFPHQIVIRCDMEMRSSKNNFSVSSVQKGWGQCSLQEAEKLSVFSPLVRVFSLQFVHQHSNRLLLTCRLFETDVKIEREGRNATSNRVNVNSIHLFLVYLCQRVRQGE